jgi:hypothetical protein
MGTATPKNPFAGAQVEPKCRIEAVLVRKFFRGRRHALLIRILLATSTVEIFTEILVEQGAMPRWLNL